VSSFSELIEVCQHSTEFHFPSIDDQLEKIRSEVKEAVAWRHSHWGCNSSGEHLVNLTSSEQQVRIFRSIRHECVQVQLFNNCLWILKFVTASFMFRKIGVAEKNIHKLSLIGHLEEEKNFLLLLGFESQVVQLIG
jgi:hypothetical protein